MARIAVATLSTVAGVALVGCALIAGSTSGYSEPPAATSDAGVTCLTTSACSDAGGGSCCYAVNIATFSFSTACTAPGTACAGGSYNQLCSVDEECGDGGNCTIYTCEAKATKFLIGTCGPSPCP